jgi:hypothetical protein
MGGLCFSTSADKAVRRDVSAVTEILHRITSETSDTPFLASRRWVEGALVVRKLFGCKEGGRNRSMKKTAQ